MKTLKYLNLVVLALLLTSCGTKTKSFDTGPIILKEYSEEFEQVWVEVVYDQTLPELAGPVCKIVSDDYYNLREQVRNTYAP